MTTPKTYVWDTYVEEADAPDFVLTDKAGTELLRVTNPTGTRVMRVSEGLRRGDLEVILMGLTGDAFPDAKAWGLALYEQLGFQRMTERLRVYEQALA